MRRPYANSQKTMIAKDDELKGNKQTYFEYSRNTNKNYFYQ